MKYLENLREISISGNNENKVDNKIGDEGFKAILNKTKYLSNLEKMYLNGNKEKIENRLWNNIRFMWNKKRKLKNFSEINCFKYRKYFIKS